MWSTEQGNDAIIYIARKLHWSRETIGHLTPAQLAATFNHLQQQELKDRHEHLSELAMLLSVISNAPIPRRNWRGTKASNFYPAIDSKEQGVNGKSQSKLEKMASEKGIIMPKYKEG